MTRNYKKLRDDVAESLRTYHGVDSIEVANWIATLIAERDSLRARLARARHREADQND